MTARSDAARLQQQALDFVFARLGGDPVAQPPGEEQDAESEPTPVPVVNSPDELRAASEWLARERQRLEAYTRAQLARVQEERQALAQQQYLNEQTLIFRSQELTRREEMLLTQGRSLQHQAEELTQREQSLAGQLHQWWQANEELVGLEEANRNVREDVARHRALLDTLQSETTAAQRARQEANTQVGSIQAAAEDIRESRVRVEASIKARHDQLEQRLVAADRAVLAATQQQAELDDLEAHLRREFEEQERTLLHQRKVLEDLQKQLRGERTELVALREQLATQQKQIEEAQVAVNQRETDLHEWYLRAEEMHAELEQRDEDVTRRAAEVLELEQQLQKALELRMNRTPDPSPSGRGRAGGSGAPKNVAGRIPATRGK